MIDPPFQAFPTAPVPPEKRDITSNIRARIAKFQEYNQLAKCSRMRHPQLEKNPTTIG
jgi:hypothetical protein